MKVEYKLGALHVPIFAVCGDRREILSPDDALLCVVPVQYATDVLVYLNALPAEYQPFAATALRMAHSGAHA